MTTESEKFAFTNVRLLYQESNELHADRQPRPPLVVGISAVDVFCKACGHLWTAREYGEGRFRNAAGHFLFDCPECGADEGVRAAVGMKDG
jgi:predicted RNA-binding Zn-ribbon protein involved in translation (DUF1610 family)